MQSFLVTLSTTSLLQPLCLIVISIAADLVILYLDKFPAANIDGSVTMEFQFNTFSDLACTHSFHH